VGMVTEESFAAKWKSCGGPGEIHLPKDRRLPAGRPGPGPHVSTKYKLDLLTVDGAGGERA